MSWLTNNVCNSKYTVGGRHLSSAVNASVFGIYQCQDDRINRLTVSINHFHVFMSTEINAEILKRSHQAALYSHI